MAGRAAMTEARPDARTPQLRWGLPTSDELAKTGARARWRRYGVIVVGQAVATMAACLLLLGISDHAGYRFAAWVVLASSVVEVVYGIVLTLWSRKAPRSSH